MVQPAAPSRIIILDSFRGLAAVWVVIFNLCSIPGTPVEAPLFLRPVVASGGILAAFFFVLSGFCLALASSQNSQRSPTEFYLRRAFRILPLFYLMVLLQIFIGIYQYNITRSYDFVLSNIFLFFNFVPRWQEGIVWLSWTIGVTACFYALFPWLSSQANRGTSESIKVFGQSVILAIISQAIIEAFANGGGYWEWSFIRFLPVFILGLLTHSIWVNVYRAKINKSHGGAYLTVGLALLTFVILKGGDTLISPLYLEAFSFAFVILGGVLLQPTQGWVQSNMSKVGGLSYSIYLAHPLLIFILIPFYEEMSKYLLSDSLLFFLSVTLTLVIVGLIAWVCRRYIEEPGLKVGEQISKRLKLVIQQTNL